MNPYIRAKTATELRDNLDADLHPISPLKEINDTQWNERAQLTAFLKAVADTDLVSYPLDICHTSEATPDFKLSFSGSAVGIEASRITNETLHRFEKLRHQGKTADVVSISPLLVDSSRMNNDELLARTTAGATTGASWNDFSSEEDFWLECARNMIARKTEIRRKDDYQDCGQNWLLLWDRLSIAEDEARTRAHLLQGELAGYWNKAKIFDRIILECEELRRFTVLSREGSQLFKG